MTTARIIGVDGEGHDLPDGRHAPDSNGRFLPDCVKGACKGCLNHVYTYFAAVDETGKTVAETRFAADGLTHDECLAVIYAIPPKALIFWFSGGYDLTMIMKELPPDKRYLLVRPDLGAYQYCGKCERRASTNDADECKCGARTFTQYDPIPHEGARFIWFAGSLAVSAKRPGNKTRSRWTIWDCFRFFGCSFVNALKNWSIGTEEQRARILAMKNNRGKFQDEKPEDVMAYCREECHLLALMMRKVIDAHAAIGYTLKRYEGAGSSASAMLTAEGVKQYLGGKELWPEGLERAVMSAFFGGRFECSRIGVFAVPVQNFDISSAYPYAQATEIPCTKCGTWKHLKEGTRRLLSKCENAQLALVRFRVKPLPAKRRDALAWAPLPYRDKKGSICYPTNFTGWAWWPEFSAALDGWPELVEATGEAWIYETKCDHKPFAYVPRIYKRRFEQGKDTGEGLALKLAMNAGYGKTAQSKGKRPPFQDWVIAGMTTATTRGQLLRAICAAPNRWDVISTATDGILSLVPFALEKPHDTGTANLKAPSGDTVQKPLGGWEHETKKGANGVFVLRPGVYWPLETADLEAVRARGVGRKALHEHADKMVDGFLKWDRENYETEIGVRQRLFHGIKSSVYAITRCTECKGYWAGDGKEGCPTCGFNALVETDLHDLTYPECTACKKAKRRVCGGKGNYGSCGAPRYASWQMRETGMAFDPLPKRERRMHKGGTSTRLYVRDAGGAESVPYRFDVLSPEARAAREQSEIMTDQPDCFEDEGVEA